MGRMLYCEKCGKILELKNDLGRIIGVCDCGYVKEIDSEFAFLEKIPEKKEVGEKVDAEDKNLSGFPHVCKKCGHDGCLIHDLGAPYSDESNIYLYKCKKCGYVERQADGSGNK